MTIKTHLEGHVALNHALSPRWQFDAMPAITRALTAYPTQDLWQTDFERLPKALGRIRQRARTFAEQHLMPVSAQLDLAPHLPAGQAAPEVTELLRKAGQDGWLTYFLPAPFGSMPWSAVGHPPIFQCALVVEEFSRACGGLMLLLSAHHLGVMPLLLSGNVSTLLQRVRPIYQSCMRGDPHLVAFAITEPGAGSDAEEGHGAEHYRPGVVAKRADGGWLLNGRKCYISGGDLAQSLTVFAALDGEDMSSWTCFHVDAHAPGFTVVRTELKMGMRASGAAELEFDNVFVPDAAVIGGLRKGWVLNRATLNASRIPVASMGVGFARAATELAIDFARSTRLGGKPLIDYQEVQLTLATLVAETRALRSLVWQEAQAAWQPRQLHASLCKFHVTDHAQRVCEMAMDLMGDQASLHEMRLERVLRDVRLTRIFEGTNQINRLSLVEDWQGQLLNNPFTVGV